MNHFTIILIVDNFRCSPICSSNLTSLSSYSGSRSLKCVIFRVGMLWLAATTFFCLIFLGERDFLGEKMDFTVLLSLQILKEYFCCLSKDSPVSRAFHPICMKGKHRLGVQLACTAIEIETFSCLMTNSLPPEAASLYHSLISTWYTTRKNLSACIWLVWGQGGGVNNNNNKISLSLICNVVSCSCH